MTYDPFFETRPEPPAGRGRRSPETWAAIRAGYLQGDSADQLCERYGVGLSALRTRAREEGWRRSDLADPAPVADDALTEIDETPLSAAELAALAWKRTSAAVRQGRLRDAVGWERLARNLRRRAAEEAREGAAAREAVISRVAADAAEITRTLNTVRRGDEGAWDELEALVERTPPLPSADGGKAESGSGDPTLMRTRPPADVGVATPIPGPSPIQGEGREPHASHGVLEPPPPPYRPTGPALPLHPPTWVCERLGMRAR